MIQTKGGSLLVSTFVKQLSAIFAYEKSCKIDYLVRNQLGQKFILVKDFSGEEIIGGCCFSTEIVKDGKFDG